MANNDHKHLPSDIAFNQRLEDVLHPTQSKEMDGVEQMENIYSIHSPVYSEVSPNQRMDSLSTPQQRSVYTLSIDVFFNARHFVTTTKGKGKIHAHTYRVTVTTRQKIEPGMEFIYGFGIFRSLVQQETLYFEDHLLNEISPFSDKYEPTTEHIAVVLYQKMKQKLPAGLELESVTIWESPTARVTFKVETI